MLTLRLERALEDRLSRLAERTGRTKTFYVKQALWQFLEDHEDAYLAHEVVCSMRDKEGLTTQIEDVIAKYDRQALDS